MADLPTHNRRSPQAWGNYVVGLVVFLAGICLMLLAFYWGYNWMGSLDQELSRVEQVKAVPTPATPAPVPAPTKGKSAPPVKPMPEVVQAQPEKGPTLGTVATHAALRLLYLLVLAGIGAMVASRGAHLAGIGAR
jgi:hypothetical protein